VIYPIILHHKNSEIFTKELELNLIGRDYGVVDSSYLKTRFSETFNIALTLGFKKMKSGEYSHVMICNNDINLNSDHLVKIESYIDDMSGVFTPSVNSPHSSVMSASGSDGLREVPWVEFICPIFSIDVLREVGYLDLDLSYGWGVELDYCYRASVREIKTFLVQNVQIQHYEHRSQEDHGEYSHYANIEMNHVLSEKYGSSWQETLKFPQW
jgi:hypothetical protein